MSREDALTYLSSLGVDSMEILDWQWNDMISTLKVVGYDGAISIEHEDDLMSPKEGLEKAANDLLDKLKKQ